MRWAIQCQHIFTFALVFLQLLNQNQVIYFATRAPCANRQVSNYQNSQFGFEAEGNKTKEMNYLSLNFKAFSFVVYPSASVLRMNLNNLKLAYWGTLKIKFRLICGIVSVQDSQYFKMLNLAAESEAFNAELQWLLRGLAHPDMHHYALTRAIYARKNMTRLKKDARLVLR